MWGLTSRLVAPAIGSKPLLATASKTLTAPRPVAIARARALPSIAANPAIRFYAGGPKTSPKKSTKSASSTTTKKASSGTKSSSASKPKKAAPSPEAKAEKEAKAKAAKELKQAKEQEKKAKAKLKAQQQKEKEQEKKEQAKLKALQQKARAKEKKEKEKEKKENQRLRARARKEKQQQKEQEKKEKAKQKPWILLDTDGKQVPLPTAPKRPALYNIFFKTRYPVVSRDVAAKTDDRRALVGETGKAIGAEWKSMSEAQKAPYQEQHAAELEAYQKAYQAWENSLSDADRKRLHQWNKARMAAGKHRVHVPTDPTKPKAPMTAFFLFMKHLRATRPDVASKTAMEQTAIGAEAWKAMSEEDKSPWKDKQEGAKQQYQADLEKWKLEQELHH